jgi:cupin fold WbuC family metalloprotein
MQPARTSTLDRFQAVAEGVFVALTPISTVGPAEIAFVKAQARSVVRRRARLCLHRSSYDRLHDMVIALDMATYLRPHRHADKSETFHIIEGSASVVIFDDNGRIERVIAVGGEKGQRLYRLDEPQYHTLVIQSEMLVIHEVTNGPFAPGATDYAAFAPAENDTAKANAYLRDLRERLQTFSQGPPIPRR